MPPSASLAIPYETAKSRKSRNLQEDVQQIVKQKGAFRHVNEAKLHLGSLKSIDDGNDEQSDHTTDTELETTQDTQKRLFVTRNELTRLYQTSLNEINTLLDLVSWLLSARSKVAQTTMSPALKGGVPIGSAEIKTVPAPELSQNAQQRLTDTSNIVRLQAFENCSEKLLAASKRLDTEAQHQSKYWDQMAEIRSKGWPVSRLPRDGRTLVAHVASTEASPQYRNKGLIPFRRDENGDLTIPDVQGAARQRYLAVSVRRRDKVTGFYQARRDASEHRSPLEDALVQAKERVFEDELFSEASREAQIIASMGAKVRSSSIEVEVTHEYTVSITYLPYSSNGPIDSHEDDDMAAFVGNSLRTMLIAEHEAKYRTRSHRTPAPMVLNPRSSPEYVLIRPVIAQMRHHINAFPFLQDLKGYQASLEAAGLPFSIDTSDREDRDPMANTLQSLRQISSSLVKINLPSGVAVELNIETQLAPPRFGTQFRSTDYKSVCGSRSLQPTSSLKAAATFVADVVARDVCHTILGIKSDNAEWKVQTDHPLELVLVKDKKPYALLAASCRSGTLAVSCLQNVAGTTQKVVFSSTSPTLIGKGGQRQETNKSLHTVVEDWAEQALS